MLFRTLDVVGTNILSQSETLQTEYLLNETHIPHFVVGKIQLWQESSALTVNPNAENP